MRVIDCFGVNNIENESYDSLFSAKLPMRKWLYTVQQKSLHITFFIHFIVAASCLRLLPFLFSL